MDREKEGSAEDVEGLDGEERGESGDDCRPSYALSLRESFAAFPDSDHRISLVSLILQGQDVLTYSPVVLPHQLAAQEDSPRPISAHLAIESCERSALSIDSVLLPSLNRTVSDIRAMAEDQTYSFRPPL